jgi:hypothetical protein
VNSGYDTDLERKLLRIEYHPFVDFVATRAEGRLCYETYFRSHYLDIPPYVMPTAMHFIRGNMLMGYLKTAELTAIQTYITQLNDDDTRKTLAELGEKLLGRGFNCHGDVPCTTYATTTSLRSCVWRRYISITI